MGNSININLPENMPVGCGCTACAGLGNGPRMIDVQNEAYQDAAIIASTDRADDILTPYSQGAGDGSAITLEYKFHTEYQSYWSLDPNFRYLNIFMTEFSSMQKSAVRNMFDNIESFTNVTFVEVSGDADPDIGFINAWDSSFNSSLVASAYYPTGWQGAGDVFVNTISSYFSQAPVEGDYAYFALMHEIGHSLGLQHTFDAGLTGAENTEQFSVMAYDTNIWGSIGEAGYVDAKTYMLYDIYSLQQLYGVNYDYNSDDTTYQIMEGEAYTIWDGGGNDTLDASYLDVSVTLNLGEGTFSSVGGLSNNIAIAFGAEIENASGGSADDILYGTDESNFLIGNDGDDHLYAYDGFDILIGGAGNDTYYYSGGYDFIEEESGVDTLKFAAGIMPTDVLVFTNSISFVSMVGGIDFANINDIEFFEFDGYDPMDLATLLSFSQVSDDDFFLATDISEIFDGGTGTDTVDYSLSSVGVFIDLENDYAFGGFADGDTLISIENVSGSNDANARDKIFGDANDNVLSGFAGNDFLEGGAGADVIDGGEGYDYARYTRSDAGVTINLTTNVNTGGHAEGDLLYSIEYIEGSAFGDHITGGSTAEKLYGRDGDDVFIASAGDDQINGGDGRDAVYYSTSLSGITSDLVTGSTYSAEFGNDRLSGIEIIYGSDNSAARDKIFGNDLDNELYGQAGDDFLEGGAGADIIDGGDGDDYARYTRSNAAVTINLATNVNTGGDAQGDLLYNIELIEGSAYGDHITGANIAEKLFGLDGNDTFAGSGGNDRLNGGNGEDTLDYSAATSSVRIDLLDGKATSADFGEDRLFSIENVYGSNDSSVRDRIYGDDQDNKIYGQAGNDILEGGAGADIIDGGEGSDYASYIRSSEGVNINLKTNVNTGGDAQGDLLYSIEYIRGSNYADNITGSDSNDNIIGESGMDIIKGGDGNDRIRGREDNDTLTGGSGSDDFIFELAGALTSVDTITDFNLAEGDTIDIADILTGYDALTSAITDYVQITDNGTDSFVAVDVDGGADNFVQIAVLSGVTGLNDEDQLETNGALITV